MNTCPYCGLPLPAREWERRDHRTFEFAEGSAVQQVLPAGADWERRRPARAASLRSDVGVPIIQATITGLLTGGVAGSVAAAAGSPYALAIGAAAGVGTTGLTWLVLLSSHHRLLWEVERITGADLDGDGDVGSPVSTRLEVQISGAEQRGRQTQFIDLPASPGQLRELAKGMLAGRLAESAWTGRGKLFSKPKFYELRDALIERGFAVWKNPSAHAQGIELTAAGRAILRRLAEG